MSDESAPIVRPYMLTGGRTETTTINVPIEAQVIALHEPKQVSSPQHRRVLETVQESTGVAEVSALLNIPLGVTRVLVSDLIEDGHIELSETAGSANIDIMRRLLDGVRSR